MSAQTKKSNLLVELNIEEQELLSGGQQQQPYRQYGRGMDDDRYGRGDDYGRNYYPQRYPTYICRPYYGQAYGS
ncbi:hypothetical protein [Sphaerospermopsis sp. FACHB-1194]|uniref:Uncharacterized protein n=1 Tax=Sphaerospermopsis reniformis TaxID=531300 RepID=A0A480A8Z4_9CYAN|nr:hypothetical protein [Sphaerospermopsis sp. FACHB-1194]MBD2148094.1 hypothetical protein [Sphaerospermopsis sp. FACHB-1194]GCL38594.1 hypothetical protein SR1949_37110 [Sphaerospermopsis reniformis]